MTEIYNIKDFGAISESSELQTASIQAAIDAAFLAGGGEVVIPEGSFLTGCIRLRSNITLHLLKNATLVGSIDPDDYCGYLNDKIEPISAEEIDSVVETALPEGNGRSARPYSRWNNAIIRAIKAKNIAIVGDEGSVIDGRNCFDPVGEESYRGPHAINMWFCENVRLEGYTIRDSANWAHAIQNSKGISARNITVLAGHDGFDVRTCNDILVEDSVFKTGDDCIAGFDNIGVTVRNCYFESACSVFRFGATDMLVENCKSVAPATYGFRGSLSPEEKANRADTTEACRHNCLNVFLYYCDNRARIRKTPGNILIRDSHFINPNSVMRLPFGHIWCCNRSLNDIRFENCIIEGVSIPIEPQCPENEPLSFYMKNCTVTPRVGFENMAFLDGQNMKRVELEGVTLDGFSDPKIICQPDAEIVIKR